MADQAEKDEIAQLLAAWQTGDTKARDKLFELLYDELRELAASQRRRLHPGATLNTTFLLHEAITKLLPLRDITWRDREHFFAVVSSTMRQVIIDYVRSRKSQKRGGGTLYTTLEGAAEDHFLSYGREDEILALDEALTRLQSFDERLARVVEYRFFMGLTVEETAAMLDVSTRKVERDWHRAKSWLYRFISEPGDEVKVDEAETLEKTWNVLQRQMTGAQEMNSQLVVMTEKLLSLSKRLETIAGHDDGDSRDERSAI